VKTADVLVVGGGIHGCGVAQAAAACGLSVLLVEKNGIAGATSSRSSKLIHGGLRYLETLQFTLVREALHERELLLRIAPALVHREDFFIPVYRDSRRPPWKIAVGLSPYRLLAGRGNGFERLPPSQWRRALPDLTTDGLRALFRYRDAATDDAALTRAVAASARSLVAELLESCRLCAARRTVSGWQADLEGYGQVRARSLVNAAGPWVNRVQAMLQPPQPNLAIELVQGSHILLPAPQEAYVYAEAADGRPVFIMPWQGRTLVGTTEKEVTDPSDPRPGEDELRYLLDAYRHYYPSRPGGLQDLVGSFAGVRVLPAGTGAFVRRSRETRLWIDSRTSPRLVSIYGGKLTTYRRTAARVMALLAPTLQPPRPEADTSVLPLRPPG